MHKGTADSERNPVRTAVYLSIIALAAFILCYPLFFSGYNLGHSGGINILCSDQFIRSIKSGEIIPGWMRDANTGNGCPLFIFYQPFIFYTSAVIGAVWPDIPLSLNISAFLAMFLAGSAMFIFARSFFGYSVSLFVSLLYMSLPYHLVDMYERAALSEHWAFVWMPAILHCANRASASKYKGAAGLAIFYGALVHTHLPTPLLFTPFLLAYFAYLYRVERDVSGLLARLAGLAVGVGLSAFYLIPAMMEQKYVKIGFTFSGWLYYANNFLFADKAGDKSLLLRLNGISIGVLSLLLIAVFLWFRQRKNTVERNDGSIFMAASGILAVLMATPIAIPLWKAVPVLQKVQFPWRFLAFATLAAAFAAGFSISALKREGRTVRTLSAGAILAVLAFNFYYSADQFKRYKHMPFSDSRASTRWEPGMDMSLYELFEYAEKYAPVHKYMLMPIEFAPVWSVEKDGFMQIPLIKEDAVFPMGEGKVETLLWEPEKRAMRIEALTDVRVLVRIYYYPRWHAYLNQEPMAISPDPSTGLITFNLSRGVYDLRLVFERSIYQKAGLAISALSLLILSMPLVPWIRDRLLRVKSA